MSHIVTTPPDMTAVLIPVVKAALSAPATAGRTYAGQARFVQVRADMQNPATPITRYCRVGLTAWYDGGNGKTRVDLAKGLATRAAEAILAANIAEIVTGEWQSGPVETTDSISAKEVAYITLLLE